MNRREQRRREDAKTAAFTLAELLVTITVVGILLALLLPTVTRSRAKVKEAVCTGNLRQVYSALHLYTADNGGRFPAGFLWSGRIATAWNSKEFIGGREGRDTNCPPARVRPLFPYLGASDVFKCPFDVGYNVVTKGGFELKPSQFEVVGVSYFYNGGELVEGAPQSTDGLGGKTAEWVKRPDRYALIYEPPGRPNGTTDQPDFFCVYWHRARKPGSARGLADQECGPRVSPFLFVDGHLRIVDCTFFYGGSPTGVEWRQ